MDTSVNYKQVSIFKTRSPEWNTVEAMKENPSFFMTSSLSKHTKAHTCFRIPCYFNFAKLTEEVVVPVNPNTKIRVCLFSSSCVLAETAEIGDRAQK